MRVGLFVTCLADVMRPSIGLAALDLLEQAGCEVIFPENQTCCGQPAYNAGDRATAQEFAKESCLRVRRRRLCRDSIWILRWHD
jgi:L-lactate dehydrogenase complex protein LldE